VEFRIADTFTDSERPLRILDARRQWLLPFLATVGNGSIVLKNSTSDFFKVCRHIP
jgi:hypothetical protein